MTANPPISPDRLMQAVDAIFRAQRELGSFRKMPSTLLGRTNSPRAFEGFSRVEVEEAERFLVRCDLLYRTPRKPGAAH